MKNKPAFRVGDAAFVQVVVKKTGVPVASIMQGYTEASKDAAVYAGRISDAGSDLKPDAEKLLYSNPETTDERGVFFDAGGDYQVEVRALPREDGKEFVHWTDETGVPVTTSESYSFSVAQGKSSLQSIRPIYRKPPEITAPEEQGQEKTGIPENPNGGSPWLWLGIGTGTAAVGGTVGAFWWKKRRREAGRRSRKRKK